MPSNLGNERVDRFLFGVIMFHRKKLFMIFSKISNFSFDIFLANSLK